MRLQIASKLNFGVFGLKEDPKDEEWQFLMDSIRKSEAGKQSLAELRKVRHDGLKQLNDSIPSCQHWLDYTYGVSRIKGESLSDAIRRTPTYQKNSVPQQRYVDEDIATGLLPLSCFAKRLGIDTKYSDYVLNLCDKLLPDRNKKYDRDLNEFTDDYLKRYLMGEFFTIKD
jgi:opine dehydrogenase